MYMITLYSGTPGSGKSLYASYVIWRRLLAGAPVIANFAVNLDAFGRKAGKASSSFLWLDNSELSPEVLIAYAKEHHVVGRESQTLIIIDECAVLFNSRDYGRSEGHQSQVFYVAEKKLSTSSCPCAHNHDY